MPRFHNHRAPGRMSEFAAGEPIGQQTEQPVQASEPTVQSPERPGHLSELRRLFATFGYLVAKQGSTAILGLVYWAVATHLFSTQDVGLAAAANSTALF